MIEVFSTIVGIPLAIMDTVAWTVYFAGGSEAFAARFIWFFQVLGLA